MGHHVGIVGVGQTHHSRRRTDVSQAGLVREAVNRALADAKLTMADIDTVVVASGPVLFAAVNHPEKWVVDAIGAQGFQPDLIAYRPAELGIILATSAPIAET